MIDKSVQPLDLKLTKFMVLEVAVALIMCLLFTGLALRIRGGGHAARPALEHA